MICVPSITLRKRCSSRSVLNYQAKIGHIGSKTQCCLVTLHQTEACARHKLRLHHACMLLARSVAH